jgi:Ca2+-binding EF-hand superfamily protein
VNKDGSISMPEFRISLHSLGVEVADDELELLTASFDINGDGKIAYDELCRFVLDSSEATHEIGEVWELIRKALVEYADGLGLESQDEVCAQIEASVLRNYDTGCVGLMDRWDFQEALGSLGICAHLTTSDIEKVMKCFSRGGQSSKIDYSAFMSWLYPVNISQIVKRVSRFVRKMVKDGDDQGGSGRPSLGTPLGEAFSLRMQGFGNRFSRWPAQVQKQ